MHESYCKKITSGKSVRGDTKVVPWTRKQRTEQVVGSRWSLRESGLLVVCSTGRIVMEEAGDMSMPSSAKEEETEEDDEEPQDLTKNMKTDLHLPAMRKVRHAVSGRGITLAMLMNEGIIEPGDGVMSIEYLGQRFTADLLSDGRIKWLERNKMFNSPSAWAIHCKKMVNPLKKSGCGWASVRYKGRKLDSYKSIWFKKHNPKPVTIQGNTGNATHIYRETDSSEKEMAAVKDGKEEKQEEVLTVSQAFPCRCNLNNKETAPTTEIEIRQTMKRLGMSLVGWYHSHPKCNPDPSLNDIESQMEYQLMLRGVDNSYHPCLGVVVSPSTCGDSPKEGSLINAFWVMPPPETRPLDYGLPVSLMYNISSQDGPTDHVISEMKLMVDFYKDKEGAINFLDSWQGTNETYLDRLKASLSEKLSEDQRPRYLEFIHKLLTPP
ncbi:hypothetical protein NP493_186g02012 [Ridgeia piscesae]|uniref:MPN domain-containing protein n=1 Tax=Ridgeia piscesae TaxID=27915 RepID=A0AAD9UEZ2_RIDPI|nr:hypothetical protein NP493_186g02012 [Ridgeia piscesae]